MKRGFTLIELLVVIAIISILAAIIFPVFSRAKAAAKKTACISNLSQIGKATALYMGDADDRFPYAVDAADKNDPAIWAGHPEWQPQIAAMPYFHEAIMPYVKSKELFHCPSDSGASVLDSHFPDQVDFTPTLFQKYGSSYLFRTEIAFKQMSDTSFQAPADVNVLFDGAGHWHGSSRALNVGDNFQDYLDLVHDYRYNTLYGDWHTKSITKDQMDQAWAVQL